MKKAAGILFLSMLGNALFLKRATNADHGHPGEWDFPGGHLEDGESPEDAAVRETREEIGFLPEGTRVFHTRTKGSASVSVGVAGNGAPAILPVSSGAPQLPPSNPEDPYAADYTTFVQRVTNEFVPELNEEHEGWAWAPVLAPPEPLHPGTRISLDRIGMDETAVARAIADGRLSSPQRYENVTLFAIRITGTGVAYRNALDEYVYRGPENYLNDDFLARCNGLPVVYLKRNGTKKDGFHPAGALLNSDEFAERVVGTIVLPYIAGNEVWGVARIYDDPAASDMEEKQLSTSPAVFFRDVSVNAKVQLEDGSTLLIEGKPSLLDHVCVCEQGVWDKGGPPTGVRSESRGDSAMTPEEEAKAKKDAEAAAEKEKADAARRDAEEKEKAEKEKADAARRDSETSNKDLKAIADAVGGLAKRMDAWDEAAKEKQAKKDAKRARRDAEQKTPEQLAADKAKKDAEEKEAKEEKEKADAAKADAALKADLDGTKKRLEEITAMIPKAVGDAVHFTMIECQARADEVFREFGERAPIPQNGETPMIYERRCVRALRKHSPTWAKVTDDAFGTAFADDASFGVVRDQVYEQAIKTARDPSTVPVGQLREVVKRGDGGHTVREFHGSPRAWMDQFAGATKLKAEGDWKGLPGRPH